MPTGDDQMFVRKWLTVAEVIQITGVARNEVYGALQTGELRGYQRSKNHRWRIHRDDIDTWMRGEKY